MDQHITFEVVIKMIDAHYQATCPVFPECKGTGSTSMEAIENLSQSIGDYIGNLMTSSMRSILGSKSYTEAAVDNDENAPEVRRVFKVAPTHLNVPGTISLTKSDPFMEAPVSDFVMDQDFSQLFKSPDYNDKSDLMTHIGRSIQQHLDGMSPLGFLFSLN